MIQEYQPHEQRVVDEFAELAIKMRSLTIFLSSSLYEQLDHEDRRLLREQLGHMTDYWATLSKRIARFK